jgi:hypothetical protein
MDVSLVVGPERAGNANVSRAIDRSQIRAQEDEPLADRPIYLGVKLQVVACVVAVGILVVSARDSIFYFRAYRQDPALGLRWSKSS